MSNLRPRPARTIGVVSGLSALVWLAGCDRVQERPAAAVAAEPLGMYRNMAEPGARVDAATAAEMISSYRQNRGLGPVVVDPALSVIAGAEARAMAAAGRPASAEGIKAKLAQAGYGQPGANLSAGYQTFAEAFSGWRESPGHDRVMLDPHAERMGIAAMYGPGTKYRVFWTLVVAAAPR